MTAINLREKTLQLAQRWGIPLLLLVVAGRQMILVHTEGLSPWHGGGFGMFASIDRDERRLIKLDMSDCQGKHISHVVTPDMVNLSTRDWVHLRTIPNVSSLKVLGEQLRDSITPSLFPLQTESCKPQITIQVWRMHFSQTSRKVRYAPVSPVVKVE